MNIQYELMPIDLDTRVNPDLKIIEGYGKIQRYLDEDKYEDIGYITISIINIHQLSGSDRIMAFDYSGDSLSIYEHLEKYLEPDNFEIEGLIEGTLMILNELYVNENYRNKGVGTQVLKEIIEWCRIVGIGCMSLDASAYKAEKENKLKESKRLRKFYKKYGFLDFAKDTENQSYIMYYDFTRA